MRSIRLDVAPRIAGGGRIAAIDELKGLAILLVLVYHCGGVLGFPNTLHGEIGVDIFLILSGITLAAFPRKPAWRTHALALAAGAAVVAVPLLLWALTGSARSNTAVAKLLPGNPYYLGPALKAAVEANVRTLLTTLLNGEVWSAEFLPRGGAPLRCSASGHASAGAPSRCCSSR